MTDAKIIGMVKKLDSKIIALYRMLLFFLFLGTLAFWGLVIFYVAW